MAEPCIPLSSRLTHKFYEPIILLVSLIGLTRGAAISHSPEPSIDIEDDKQVFQAFINKLGHVCDSLKAGSTVTSFVALVGQGTQSAVGYWFAVNRRSKGELEDTAAYVRRLLRIVDSLSEGHENESVVKTDLLYEILRFNRPRICFYLGTLQKQVEECLNRCHTGPSNEGESRNSEICTDFAQEMLNEGCIDHHLLITELLSLQQVVNTRAGAEATDSEYMRSDCKIITCLIKLNRTRAGALITERAASGRMLGMRSVECWSELLHTTKRILAYPQSVQFFLLARRRWPDLFHKATVSFVPSSKPTRISLRNKSLTASSIVGRMTRKANKILTFQAFAKALQAFDLDEQIETEYSKPSFAPIVHAETLMLNWLEMNGGIEASRFFRNWAYIGSSKPTCRLCDYYFQEHEASVEHRPSHGNLYPNWRLPDVLSSQDVSALGARQVMFDRVLQRVREDAFQIMSSKVPPSCKDHDSNTFSATMTLGRHWTLGGSDAAVDDVASTLSRINIYEPEEDPFGHHDSDGGVAI